MRIVKYLHPRKKYLQIEIFQRSRRYFAHQTSPLEKTTFRDRFHGNWRNYEEICLFWWSATSCKEPSLNHLVSQSLSRSMRAKSATAEFACVKNRLTTQQCALFTQLSQSICNGDALIYLINFINFWKSAPLDFDYILEYPNTSSATLPDCPVAVISAFITSDLKLQNKLASTRIYMRSYHAEAWLLCDPIRRKFGWKLQRNTGRCNLPDVSYCRSYSMWYLLHKFIEIF